MLGVNSFWNQKIHDWVVSNIPHNTAEMNINCTKDVKHQLKKLYVAIFAVFIAIVTVERNRKLETARVRVEKRGHILLTQEKNRLVEEIICICACNVDINRWHQLFSMNCAIFPVFLCSVLLFLSLSFCLQLECFRLTCKSVCTFGTS